MGKETKIGLAVIGVLMTVFGVLLFRHLQASHDLPSRGLGDHSAVVPVPAHADLEVASAESRITGSKLWDTPSTSEPAKTVEVGAGEAVDPYAASGDEPEQAVPLGRSPFQRETAFEPNRVAQANGASGKENPLRRASAELPVDDASEQVDADAPVNDSLMTVPSYDSQASADPYAMEAPESAEESLDAAVSQDLDAPIEAPEPFAGDPAMRDPFGRAANAASRAPAARGETAVDVEPAWDEPTPYAQPEAEAFEAEAPVANPRAAFDRTPHDPASDDEPGPSGARFGRFNAARDQADIAAPGQAPVEDAWRGSAPAAAPLASGADTAEPLPIENGMYTVQPGDSLWSVSEAVYGTGGYFKALAAHNRAVLPQSDKLTVGSQISVPPAEELQRDFPSLCPRPRKSAVVQAGATGARAGQPRSGRDVYIVNDGDTLFTIARYELGKATRWAEIYELNREALGEDFDYLRPGMELLMPARETEAATRPADLLRY